MFLNKFTQSLFFIFVFFLLSRLFIWFNPPTDYSDVRQDYEKYANIWYYGLPPYTKHLYEYPPATVPLLLFPLILDQAGIGKYYPNYRMEILIIDSLFFIFLALTINKISWDKKAKFKSLLLYIFLTTVTRSFLYEGIDLFFTAAITTSFLVLLWFKKRTFLRKTLSWTFFWLSTCIKFFTFPLAIPFFLTTKTKIKKDFFAMVLGFLIIWGPPLLIFRSSLSVSFVYNLARPIKYASFPANIIRWVNLLTNSEKQSDQAPDFEYYGPVSQVITKVNKFVFPLVILFFLVWSAKKIWKTKTINKINQFFLLNQLNLVYFLLLFLSAKVFSQPFHIWYLPPVSILFFGLKKGQKLALGCILFLLIIDLTKFLHVEKNIFLAKAPPIILLIQDTLRFVAFGVLLFLFRNYPLQTGLKKTKIK